jgi:hypothetical protein
MADESQVEASGTRSVSFDAAVADEVSQWLTSPVDPAQPVLALRPNELIFTASSSGELRCHLYLTNKTSDHVIFKTRATHPRRYLAGPSTGIIPPGGEQIIKILLNPQEDQVPEDPEKRAKRKDRIVVLSYPLVASSSPPELKTVSRIVRDFYSHNLSE